MLCPLLPSRERTHALHGPSATAVSLALGVSAWLKLLDLTFAGSCLVFRFIPEIRHMRSHPAQLEMGEWSWLALEILCCVHQAYSFICIFIRLTLLYVFVLCSTSVIRLTDISLKVKLSMWVQFLNWSGIEDGFFFFWSF